MRIKTPAEYAKNACYTDTAVTHHKREYSYQLQRVREMNLASTDTAEVTETAVALGNKCNVVRLEGTETGRIAYAKNGISVLYSYGLPVAMHYAYSCISASNIDFGVDASIAHAKRYDNDNPELAPTLPVVMKWAETYRRDIIMMGVVLTADAFYSLTTNRHIRRYMTPKYGIPHNTPCRRLGQWALSYHVIHAFKAHQLHDETGYINTTYDVSLAVMNLIIDGAECPTLTLKEEMK